MTTTASALIGIHGERVALTDVSVSAVLRDLLSKVTVSQTYRNDERVNIEAVYTFPLPLDAVLLELDVEIGGRVLKAAVVEKANAEESYENAVAAGDRAVMLQEIEPGLYTMNVGNLLPGETAKITFSYTILYRWADDRLRLFLPTTVAPRYGESRHAPHQTPESSLTVENQFSLKVEIFGSLREAQFSCPSHQVHLAPLPDRTVITLQVSKAVMDRDFILNLRAPQAVRSFTLCDRDGDGLAAIASFQPFFPGLHQPRPLKLAIVVDCSGSMQGDSMGQAKEALGGMLKSLKPEDRVTIVAFGSTTKALSNRLLACNTTNLNKANQFAKQLDANMGGTEIAEALRETYAAIDAPSGDIFLLTDGEVADWESVVEEAKRSGHRIFTVGVGSAVSEAFVQKLASATGGACELVSPQEGMSERVLRHFERMRAPRAARVSVQWPEGACEVFPTKFGAVFEGDTIFASARFKHRSVTGDVALEVETDGGEVFSHRLPIAPAADLCDTGSGLSTVARVAASARMKELDKTAALDTALRYRLVSPWTNWLVIDVRAGVEEALEMPALRKVPQTLAAGWGGVGTLMCSMNSIGLSESSAMPMFSLRMDRKAVRAARTRKARTTNPQMPEHFRQLLIAIEDDPSLLEINRVMDLLVRAGIAGELNELFQHAADLGLDIDAIAAIIVARVLNHPLSTYLPDEANSAVAALQEFSQESMTALREMGQHGTSLADAVKTPRVRRILQLQTANSMAEMAQRLARFPDFLGHLESFALRLIDQLKGIKAA